MAPKPDPAPARMSPAEALETLATVRGYREGLTARAAGIIWMVWGATLGFMLATNMVFEFADSTLRASAYWPGAITVGVAGLVAAVVVGGLLTNMIWRAHALGREGLPPPWVAFAAAVVFILAFIGLSFILKQVLYNTVRLGFNFAPLLLFGSLGCLTMAVLLKGRVRPTAGLAASGALFAAFLAAYFVPVAYDYGMQMLAALAFCLAIVAAFVTVGLIHARNG